MKTVFLKRFLRAGTWSVCLSALALAAAAALVIRRPTDVVVYLVNRLEPRCRFTADAIRWTSSSSIRIENAQFARVLKVPRIYLRWDWDRLWSRHLAELKLERPEIFLDLGEIAKIGENARRSTLDAINPPVQMGAGSQRSAPSTQHSQRSWHLDRFSVERGGLVMVGLGPGVPPLEIDGVEGQFDNVPLGGNLSDSALQKRRKIELRNIHIHSPLDLSMTLLKMEKAVFEFHFAGLRSHKLDSLVFYRPVLELDRGFFWFVDELRRAQASKPPSPPSALPWTAQSFRIQEGRLDISRLHEISVQYPFEFEVARNNINLQDLSLAQFQIDLKIPNQNATWDAMQMSLQNLRGKIAFNLGGPPRANAAGAVAVSPNNVVNTLYVDTIHWKGMELTEGWLAMTFAPKEIDSRFGGAIAGGYVSGGVTCGWSGKEPWRAWGSAADIDAGNISTALGYEAFSMDGHAQLAFDVAGKAVDLRGVLKLDSLSTGTIQIRSMDRVLDRIRKNTEGIKQELMQAFVRGLRDYPYKKYALEINYLRPNATLAFRAESDIGARRLDLNWHGRENDELRIKN